MPEEIQSAFFGVYQLIWLSVGLSCAPERGSAIFFPGLSAFSPWLRRPPVLHFGIEAIHYAR